MKHILAAATLAGSFLLASPAMAAPINTPDAAPRATLVGESCVSVADGTFCVSKVSGGYRNMYYKRTTSGYSTVRADFNIVCKDGTWFGDEGAFNISTGQTRSYIHSVSRHGGCKGKLYDITRGKTYETGYVS